MRYYTAAEPMAPNPRRVEIFHESRLGARADHYTWMKQPQAVVSSLLG